MAYYRLEPWGPLRQALYAAVAVIACLSPWRKRSARRLKPADIFPELGDGNKDTISSLEQMKQKARRWVESVGGKIL